MMHLLSILDRKIFDIKNINIPCHMFDVILSCILFDSAITNPSYEIS